MWKFVWGLFVGFSGMLLIWSYHGETKTYSEANPVEYAMWQRDYSYEMPSFDYKGNFELVCLLWIGDFDDPSRLQFPKEDAVLNNFLDTHNIKIIIQKNPDLKAKDDLLVYADYQVVLIDKMGNADVWSFDENRIKVAFNGAENSGNGCKKMSKIDFSLGKPNAEGITEVLLSAKPSIQP